MRNTTHYNLNIVEGTDIVNPLVVDNPNYEAIDEAMWDNAVTGIPLATELKGGTIHAITRSNREASMFRFVATSDFVAGETFTVDGVQVTAYTTNSAPLATNAYRIGASVIGCLVDTVLTLFVATPISVAEDSEKLGGQLPSYYAKQSALDSVSQVAQSAGNLAQQNQQNLAGRQNISMNLVGTTLYITY